jgi:hypothetical protein
MHRVSLALAFSVGLVGFASGASAAPSLTQTQATNPTSPIIQVDRRCGPGRHYVPRRRVRGRDGRMHWVGGACVRG